MVEDHAQRPVQIMGWLRKLLTNPGHDEYMCIRRKCKTCEIQDTGHFEALKDMNDLKDE